MWLFRAIIEQDSVFKRTYLLRINLDSIEVKGCWNICSLARDFSANDIQKGQWDTCDESCSIWGWYSLFEEQTRRL